MTSVEGNCWRVEIVNLCFDQPQAKEILAIPLGTSQEEDDVIWSCSRNGEFTVNTAYRLAMNCEKTGNGRDGEGSSRDADGSWNLMWSANAAPKVKHHSWRMSRDALPTCVNLVKRGLDVDPMCPRCGEAYENVTHLMLDCALSSRVWKLSPFQIEVGKRDENDASWCFNTLAKLQQEDKSLLLTILWAIWQGRNKWIFKQKWMDPMAVVTLATNFHMAYENAQEKRTNPTSSEPANRESWHPPSSSIVKLNVDASVCGDGSGGFGGVVRNEFGEVMGSTFRFMERAWE